MEAPNEAARQVERLDGPSTGTRPGAASTPVTLDSSTLFAGGDEVRLVHRGQEYRLRITRQGKLILTK